MMKPTEIPPATLLEVSLHQVICAAADLKQAVDQAKGDSWTLTRLQERIREARDVIEGVYQYAGDEWETAIRRENAIQH